MFTATYSYSYCSYHNPFFDRSPSLMVLIYVLLHGILDRDSLLVEEMMGS